MSDEGSPEVETSEGPDSTERLLALGSEARRKRGRPLGSKNRPKEDGTPVKVSESNQRRIFAGALMAVFALLGVVLGWFGYEYFEKLEMTEAEEGGTYLIPIAQQIGWVATAAFYLSFPAWFIVTASKKYRKKPEMVTAAGPPPPPTATVSPVQAAPPFSANGGLSTGQDFSPPNVEGTF